MTAADRPSVPRVGDTISTTGQLDALPVGVVMRARNDLLMETGRLASGDRVVWGEGWSDHADAIEHFAPLTVLYVPGEPSRPSVTDDARAEANRRYSSATLHSDLTYPAHALDSHRRGAFVAGAEWAAGRAETTTACTCDPAPPEIGGPSHRPGCGEAETTTATDEDKTVIERAATVITANTDEPMWSAVVIAKEMASRGLLATACTRAETTTATTEDIHALDARWFERWETEQPLADKHAGYYQGRVSAIAQCREELLGLLATARTRPTREQIARALDHAGAFCGECGAEPGDFFDSCLECQRWLLNYADAVLTLLEGGER